MPLSPCDLIDRDLEQVAETVAIDVLSADTLDDPTDRLPVDPHQRAGRRLIHARRQPRHEIVEVAGEPRTVPSERHSLDMHPVLGACKPPQRRADLQPPDPQVQMPPR